MKKLLAIILALTMTLGLLAACGGSGDSPPAQSNQPAQSQQPSGDAQQPSGNEPSGETWKMNMEIITCTFDQSPVSTEMTAVSAVITQYALPLECGIVDPDTVIPEFLSALQAAGIDKVIAENQSQLNAWLAAQ